MELTVSGACQKYFVMVVKLCCVLFHSGLSPCTVPGYMVDNKDMIRENRFCTGCISLHLLYGDLRVTSIKHTQITTLTLTLCIEEDD